jgi:hypothetical protein
MISADGSLLNGTVKPQNRMLAAQPKPSSVLRLSTQVASPQPCRKLAESYKISGGIRAVQCNLEAARQLRRPDHELIWRLIASSLTADLNPVQEKSSALPPRFKRKNADQVDPAASRGDSLTKGRNVDALSQM